MSHDIVIDSHILNIIQNHEISEQSDLKELLKARGHDVPQATLSRRLKKLNIAKIYGVYQVLELKQPTLPLVLNMQVSEFGMVVLHTHPGYASSLAYFLDQKYVTYSQKTAKDSGILGTIAGDDTVLLILKRKSDLENILSVLHDDFPYLS